MDEMKLVKTVLERIKFETGVAPSIGHLAKPNQQQLWIDLIKQNLERDMHAYYLKCIFSIMVHRLKEAFVGEVQDLLVQSKLEWCTQLRYNAQLQRAEEILVIQHYEEFTKIISRARHMRWIRHSPSTLA
jgi:hypothetical protein